MDPDKKDKLEDIAQSPESRKLNLLKGKKYSICTCGHSKNIPFCDDSHRKINEEKGTNYKSLKICPEADTVLYVHSKNWNMEKSMGK